MTVTQADYTKLLLTYNFSDTAGQTLLDNPNTTADDDHVKVNIVNGKYVVNYFLFNSVPSMADTGYYDVPGNDIGSDSAYDSFYTYLAEDGFSNKDPSLTTNQTYVIQNVLSTALTDDYSVTFEDVANISFNAGTADDAHITFGQLKETHPGLGSTTGAGTVIYDPNISENTKERHGDVWFNQDFDLDNNDISDWAESGTGPGSLLYHAVMHEVMHSLGVDVRGDINNLDENADTERECHMARQPSS